MQNNKEELLYSSEIEIIYPFVGLTGTRSTLFYQNPFISLAQVEFTIGGVTVKTIEFDSIEKINLRIFKGIPDFEKICEGNYLTSGLIFVEENKISLDAMINDVYIYPCKEGLYDILVVLDDEEVQTKTVRNITFYIQQFRTKVKKKWFQFSKALEKS